MLNLGLNSVFVCLFDNIGVVVTGIVNIIINVVVDSKNAFIGLPVNINSQVQQINSPLEFFTPGLGLLVVDKVVINKVVLEPSPVSVNLKGEWLNFNIEDLGVEKNNHGILVPSPCLLESFFNVLNRQLVS